MGSSNVCPFCGQPLVDRAAVAHLHRERQKFERSLRQEAERKVAASLRPQLTAEIRGDLERLYSRRDKDRWATIRHLRAENAVMRRRARQAEKQAAARLRPKLAAEIRNEFEEKYRRRDKAKDKIIERLQEQAEVMQRQLAQTNAGDVGELGEEDLLQSLQQAFQRPGDDIKPVGRGKAGADIVHKVIKRVGGDPVVAGIIVYECKDTLKWQEAFVAQAKDARAKYGTPHVVLVSRAFPRKEKHLSWRDGVPVVHPSRAVPLAQVIRKFIVEMHRVGFSDQDVARKTEDLYAYVRSEKFRRHLLDIIDIGEKLNKTLRTEKKQHTKLWLRREQAYTTLEEKSSEIDEAIRAIVERASADAGRKATHRPRVSLQVR